MNNLEKDKKELMLLPKNKSNLCKHNAIYFQSLAYFWIAFSIVTPLVVLVNKYWFQLLTSLNIYIKTLEHKKKQFAAEQQVLKFYKKYIKVVAKQNSEFAEKGKERRSWQIAEWAKKNLDTLARPLHNHNAVLQISYASKNTATKTITVK